MFLPADGSECQQPNSWHFTISCMTTTLALRTLQEIRRHPAKPRIGEPLRLGKPDVAQGVWSSFEDVNSRNLKRNPLWIHWNSVEASDHDRCFLSFSLYKPLNQLLSPFIRETWTTRNSPTSWFPLVAGFAAAAGAAALALGMDGTRLFWEVLMDDSHWFSPYLPIWRRDTVPSRQTPVKRQHHQLLHAYGEWTQHHFGIPAVSESNLCRHDTHMPQYTCTLYVLGTVP